MMFLLRKKNIHGEVCDLHSRHLAHFTTSSHICMDRFGSHSFLINHPLKSLPTTLEMLLGVLDCRNQPTERRRDGLTGTGRAC